MVRGALLMIWVLLWPLVHANGRVPAGMVESVWVEESMAAEVVMNDGVVDVVLGTGLLMAPTPPGTGGCR
jgi:hypothetical protein